jgi:uncharacterized RDD family membrane protein YckC
VSENNVEEKEILEEQVTNEESINVTEETEEVQVGLGQPKVSFIKSLSAVIVDEVIIGIISVILLYILEALLKLSGYSISQKSSMMLLIFVVVSIFYTSIIETVKGGKTVGKKLLNL